MQPGTNPSDNELHVMSPSQPSLRRRTFSLLRFYLLSIAVGIVAALGAVIFRGLIAVIHNLLFLAQFSFHYDANVHTPAGPWGIFIILVPVIGAAGVVWLVGNFAPEAKGHGVPEVMDAIYYRKGIIRPAVAVIKAIASALSIGSGGSVGREGPIVQIGSSFGSTIGQLLNLSVSQRVTLISAGAGAGIAATFNTPIGGVLFAVELMLHEVSARTLVPVTIATAVSSYIGRVFFGSDPSFVIPTLDTAGAHQSTPVALLVYALLGAITGLISVVFIWSIYAFEDFFEKRVPGNYYTRHMAGMLVLGVMMYVLLQTTGHYHIEGVGYSTIEDILSGSTSALFDRLVRLEANRDRIDFGVRSFRRNFLPCAFFGTTSGGFCGFAIHHFLPNFPISNTALAVAGMAGVVGGSTGAALAAIVMIFEMTLDYTVIIPITVTVALSYGIRKLLHPQSIYTEKLSRRGEPIPDALQANFFPVRQIYEIMDTEVISLAPEASLDSFVQTALQHPDISTFLVKGPAGLLGILTRDAALRPSVPVENNPSVAELANRRFIVVSKDLPVFDVMMQIRQANADAALVVDRLKDSSDGAVCGIVTRESIANSVMQELELFAGE